MLYRHSRLLVFCAIIASAAAAPSRQAEQPIKFHAVTREQYNEILRLTGVKAPTRHRSVDFSTISNDIRVGWNRLLNIGGSDVSVGKNKVDGYPLCIVKTSDVTDLMQNSDSIARQAEEYLAYGDHSHYPDAQPVINCIVVLQPKPTDGTTETPPTTQPTEPTIPFPHPPHPPPPHPPYFPYPHYHYPRHFYLPHPPVFPPPPLYPVPEPPTEQVRDEPLGRNVEPLKNTKSVTKNTKKYTKSVNEAKQLEVKMKKKPVTNARSAYSQGYYPYFNPYMNFDVSTSYATYDPYHQSPYLAQASIYGPPNIYGAQSFVATPNLLGSQAYATSGWFSGANNGFEYSDEDYGDYEDYDDYYRRRYNNDSNDAHDDDYDNENRFDSDEDDSQPNDSREEDDEQHDVDNESDEYNEYMMSKSDKLSDTQEDYAAHEDDDDDDDDITDQSDESHKDDNSNSQEYDNETTQTASDSVD